jgi:hypothetical protein
MHTQAPYIHKPFGFPRVHICDTGGSIKFHRRRNEAKYEKKTV